jgi:hypothetical protein
LLRPVLRFKIFLRSGPRPRPRSNSKPLFYLPKWGEAICSDAKHWFGNLTNPSHRKADNKMPSPLGEGQVNMPIITPIRERSLPPINHLNQDEVYACAQIIISPVLPSSKSKITFANSLFLLLTYIIYKLAHWTNISFHTNMLTRMIKYAAFISQIKHMTNTA